MAHELQVIRIAVWILGGIALIAVAGSVLLAYSEKRELTPLYMTASTCVGALIGILVPTPSNGRGPSGTGTIGHG